MTHGEFAKLQAELFFEIEGIAQTKGIEYASSTTDRLANFKRLSVEMEIPSRKVGYIFYKKHIDAITTYLKDGRVYSEEGIRGRFLNAINYLTLIYGLIVDEQRNSVEANQENALIMKGLGNNSKEFKSNILRTTTINTLFCAICLKEIREGELYKIHVNTREICHEVCPNLNDKNKETTTSKQNK